MNNDKLSVKDKFLLVVMKLRMGLSDIDLAECFNLLQSTGVRKTCHLDHLRPDRPLLSRNVAIS